MPDHMIYVTQIKVCQLSFKRISCTCRSLSERPITEETKQIKYTCSGFHRIWIVIHTVSYRKEDCRKKNNQQEAESRCELKYCRRERWNRTKNSKRVQISIPTSFLILHPLTNILFLICGSVLALCYTSMLAQVLYHIQCLRLNEPNLKVISKK